ncbi:phage tail tape measure protein [Exiguobacterium sp. SH5S4]|uniref:phage tail tape measure protein n=1 Tax=Exiguobacterium sp. SH5S4 TaxID=2510961 RepID=UPI00103DB222|nr:phage tail tape measure protein [Exiguobacterium sp. SH5S4]TCI25574.1 phage tail tape measure protein [Exiguobacterium sp. SH5S4]
MANAQTYEIAFKLAGMMDPSMQKAFNQAHKTLGKTTKETNEVEKSNRSLGKSFSALKGPAIAAAAAIGTAIAAVSGVAAIKGAVNTFADFEKAMSNVKAVSGATGKDFEQLSEVAREMGKQTSKSAAEAADGLQYLALAGWDTQQMMAGIEPVLRLSEAGAIDLGRASDLVTDSMSALGIQVDQLPGFLDKVAHTSRRANTNIDALMEAFLVAGGTLNTFNVPLEEANAILGIMANRGFKGSEAGTALNAIMVNLTSGLGAAGAAMTELNLNAFDSEGKFRGLETIFMDVKNTLADMTDEQRAQYISMIAGKEHLKTFTGILEGLGNEYGDLKGEIQSADGALMEMANTQMDNLHGSVEILKSAWSEMNIAIGERVAPAVRYFVEYGTAMLPKVQDKIMGIVDSAGKMLKPLAAAKDILTGDFVNGRKIMLELGYDHKQIDAFRDRIKEAKEFANTAFAGIKMFSGDFAQGRKLMLDVGFDHKQIDAFRDRVKSVRDVVLDVRETAIEMAQMVGGQFLDLAKKVGGDVLGAFGQVTSFWQENGASVAGYVGSVITNVGNMVSGFLSLIESVYDLIAPFLPKIIGFFVDIGNQLLTFWQENGAQVLQAVQNIFAGIVKVVQFLAPVVLPILKMIWDSVAGLIQGAVNIIMGVIKIFSGIFTGDFAKVWEGVKQLVVGAVQFIWNYVNLMFIGRILGGIKALGAGLLKNSGAMWAGVKNFFKNGAENAYWLVKELGTKVIQTVWKMVTNALQFYRNLWLNAVRIFQTLKAFGVKTFAALKDTVVNVASNMANGVRSRFGLMRDRAVEIVTNMKKLIKNRFDDIISMARALPGKMGEGIKAMGGKAADGAVRVGNLMLEKIGNAVNGVINGLNWVGGKLGIDTKIPTWAVPQYANGTKGHPGGLAVLGDGRGSNAGPELYRTPNGRVGLSPATDTLMNLPKGTEVINARATRAVLAQQQIPQYALGNVKDAFRTGMQWVGEKTGQLKDAAFDVFSYLSDPTKLLSKVLDQFGVALPQMSGAFGDIGKGAFGFVKDQALTYIKGILPKMSESTGGSLGAAYSGSGAGVARSAITQALAMLNKPLSLLNPLMTIAQKESGFNPNAINDWDINAQRGDPSVGLFQIINSTFQRWKMPGFNNRRNPLDSALAAIRYMDGRYGGIMNHPGIQNMMRGGGYLPYANGGIVTNAHLGLVGEAGPEAIIPLSEEKRGRATNLLRRVASRFGLELGDRSNPLRDLLDFGKGDDRKTDPSADSNYQFVYSPVVHMAPGSSRQEVEDALKFSYDEFRRMAEQFEREKRRNRY